MKISNDTIGNRTRDLPTCSAMPQPTALTRALPMAIGPPKPHMKCTGIEHGPPMNQRIEHNLYLSYFVSNDLIFLMPQNKTVNDKLAQYSTRMSLLRRAVGHFCCTAFSLPGRLILQLTQAAGCLHYWDYSTASYRTQCEVITI